MIANSESLHELLYKAHWSLAGGSKNIHDVIVALHNASRYPDDRAKIKGVIAKLELARDAADAALKAASDARIELIGLTGCDGKCSDRARKAA